MRPPLHSLRPLLWLAAILLSAVISPFSAPLAAQPAPVLADPTTGALFRPSAALFATGNSLLTTSGAAAAYQPLAANLTSWAAITRASGFDTFTATPSGANLATLLTSSIPTTKGGTGATDGPQALANLATRSIGIWCIGDSHIEGRLMAATVSSERYDLGAFNSPRDRHWTGTADAAYFPANNSIGSAGSSNDPNIAPQSIYGSLTSLLPFIIRSGYPSISTIRIANTAVGGASSYTWAGNQARCYIYAYGNASVNDTITLGSVTYTFVASASSANQITIGASAAATLQNLCNAINLESTGWGTGTAINPQCFCPNNPSATLLTVFAVTPGTSGNSLALSATGTGILNWSEVPGWGGGSTSSGLYPTAKALVPAGFGTVDVVLIGLGTNDAARQGYRGRGTQSALTSLVAAIAADYPSAKIVMWRPPVSGAGGSTASALTSTVIPAVDAVIAANPNIITGVDMYSIGAGSSNTSILSSDGVHLSNYGYALGAQIFARGIITALAIP